ncbi:MAG TPA: hypothetical protein VK468_11315 [Pyrinomonadaceae bacterium]|nr:hypothetical protein [Pyrinomonadaceae bacterium]
MHSKENLLLNPDFIDILSAFSEEKVEYLVVGGYAMAFHGFVRATGDIDLWIRVEEENAGKVRRALQSFGAPLGDLTIEDLLTPGMVYQMGVVPNRIDVINDITGVDFDEAWAHRTSIEFHALTIPLIGKEQLLQNKKATGRAKDLGDVIRLEEGSENDPF